MKTRIIAFVFAVVLIVVSYPITTVGAAEPEITIISAEIDNNGEFEVIGQVEGVAVGTQVSFLMCCEEAWDATGHIIESKFNVDYVAYIDQVGTGNNGTFVVQGRVGEKWENQTLRFAGASSYGGYYTQTMSVPKISYGIEIIANNSVIYGCDAYLVTGAFYNADNIATSIKEGGNRIYYKLGDKWYDLLDPDALDNSFLVSQNAMSDSEVEECKPRYYYDMTKQIHLNYN